MVAWLACPSSTELGYHVPTQETLVCGMSVNRSLQKLILGCYATKTTDIGALMAALEGHPVLEELRVDCTRVICERGRFRLAHMPSLIRCWVFSRSGTPMGMEVDDMPSLKSLRMNKCGIVELPDTLLELPNLEELRLEDNALSTAPCSAVSDG